MTTKTHPKTCQPPRHGGPHCTSKFRVTGADVDGGVLLRISSRFLGLLRHGEIDSKPYSHQVFSLRNLVVYHWVRCKIWCVCVNIYICLYIYIHMLKFVVVDLLTHLGYRGNQTLVEKGFDSWWPEGNRVGTSLEFPWKNLRGDSLNIDPVKTWGWKMIRDLWRI